MALAGFALCSCAFVLSFTQAASAGKDQRADCSSGGCHIPTHALLQVNNAQQYEKSNGESLQQSGGVGASPSGGGMGFCTGFVCPCGFVDAKECSESCDEPSVNACCDIEDFNTQCPTCYQKILNASGITTPCNPHGRNTRTAIYPNTNEHILLFHEYAYKLQACKSCAIENSCGAVPSQTPPAPGDEPNSTYDCTATCVHEKCELNDGLLNYFPPWMRQTYLKKQKEDVGGVLCNCWLTEGGFLGTHVYPPNADPGFDQMKGCDFVPEGKHCDDMCSMIGYESDPEAVWKEACAATIEKPYEGILGPGLRVNCNACKECQPGYNHAGASSSSWMR